MPTARQTANTSGLVLFNGHLHKVGVVTGLKINNQSTYDELLRFMDCFATDAAKTMAADAAQASEDFGAVNPLSGKVRMEITVPAGEFQSFAKEDLQDMKFFGDCAVIAGTATSDCVVVAQYHME